ncbi:hypothetical protein ACQF4J_32115 [Streptomyces sp. C1-1]|uniref:hypothetical protein n=1 Tax=Streptomyces sp. C1-1 TaxID=3231173 RepID=UPI003CFDF528
MSRDEEKDDPGAVHEHAAPGHPVDISKRGPFAEASGPAPYLSVVISADGSATIDGVSVSATDGESVDAAILDALHAHAVSRNSAVTAAISDPSVEQVTFVEVAPDGSSSLVDQLPTPAPGSPQGPAGVLGEPEDAAGYGLEHGPGLTDFDEAPVDAADDDLDDEEPYGRPQASPAPPVGGALLRRQKPDGTNAARQSDDEYRAAGLLHRPLVVGPVALGVAALVVVPLVLLGSGGSGGGQNKAAGASDELTKSPSSHGPSPTPTPTVSVSPSLLSPSPSASPSGKGKRGAKGKKHTDGATGVTSTVTVRPPAATATVTAKPAADTAAGAVNRLARNDPGRHICYRAYVSGQGWQKPVCDGTVAGTTGQNRSIKALNIAVRGTGGTAANAFVHKPGSTDGKGVWMPHWTANTADGKDIYIGHARKSAPNMLGFAINVGSGGQVCQSARVHNSDWGQWGCVGPRPEYVFGGTLTNDVWLEAVKFTV